MRNSRKHFETVPLAEALRHAVDVSGNWSDQKASTGNMPREISFKERGVDNGIRARQPERATRVKATPRRVLVVDDERDVADMVVDIFRHAGYEAAVAYDAISGLAHCEALPPDLVITDVVMPGMNGIELAMVIKQLFPACKILLLSELAASEDVLQEARTSGYDFELLRKPVDREELLAKLAM